MCGQLCHGELKAEHSTQVGRKTRMHAFPWTYDISRCCRQSADQVVSGCQQWRKLCRRGTPGRFRDEQTASAIVTCRNHVTLSRDLDHVIESPIVTPQIHKSFSPWTASVVLTSRTPTVFAHLLCWLMFVLHYCYLCVRLSVRLSHWRFTAKNVRCIEICCTSTVQWCL